MLTDAIAKSGTYSVATFAQRLVGLVMVPIYTRYLTPQDYGVMALLDLVLSMFGLVVSVKLGQSLFYHWPRAASDEERQEFVGNAFVAACGLGLIGAMAGWIAAPMIGSRLIGVPGARYYLSLTFISFACNFPIDIGFSLMRIKNQAKHFMTASLLRLALGVALNIVTLVHLGMGLDGMLLGSVATSLTLTAYMAVVVVRGLHFRLRLRIVRELVRYSFPLLVSGACLFVINSADRLFLRWYVPLSEVGLYTLAYKLGMLVMYAYSPVELYWSAQMHQVLRRPEGVGQFPRLLTYVVLYLAAVTVGITLFVEPISQIAIGADFRGAMKYTPWVALACLIRVAASMGRSALFVSGKTKLEARVTLIGAALTLAGYAVLIPRFGAWGAVAATLIGFVTLLILGQVYAQKAKRVRFEYGRLMRIAACMVVVVVLFRCVPVKAGIWQIVWATGTMAAFPILLTLSGFLQPGERARLAAYWKRWRGETAVA